MIQQQKKELRRQIRNLKEKHTLADYLLDSSDIMDSIENLSAFIKAETILLYWSIDGEVFTHDFIRKWLGTKRILLPSVDGDQMKIKLFEDSAKLIAGDKYQIPEPDGPLFTDYAKIDLVIVPGIAFDRNNNRMGRGKAYYDRFLKQSEAYKIGVCFNFQLFDKIPADENDIKMDQVITNKVRKQ